MRARVITSVVALALLVVVLFFYDTVFFNLVFAAVCVIAIHEIYDAFHFGKNSLYIFIGFIPLTFLVMLADYSSVRGWLAPAAYLFALFIAICVITHSNTVDFAKISGMSVFSIIVVFCFYSLIYLKSLLPREEYGYDAIYFLLLILGFAWGGDSAAFFAGRFFGKHKLAPVVSPNKTVEGAVGGVLGSMLVGILFTLIYIEGFGRVLPIQGVRFSYYIVIALLGIVASVLGVVGDLFASAVKRQCGIKDYGTIFPGHGGILDRFDSVLFIAPLVVMVVRVVYYYFSI